MLFSTIDHLMHEEFPGFEPVVSSSELSLGGDGGLSDLLRQLDELADEVSAADCSPCATETETKSDEPASGAPEPSPVQASLAVKVKLWESVSTEINAENERLRAERNRRRNRAERDPVKYERQKERQRGEYAEGILEHQGRAIRKYEPITGIKTRQERDEVRRERDAVRQREKRMRASQDQKDAEADRKWAARQRKKGIAESEIAVQLEQRQAARAQDGQVPAHWGTF